MFKSLFALVVLSHMGEKVYWCEFGGTDGITTSGGPTKSPHRSETEHRSEHSLKEYRFQSCQNAFKLYIRLKTKWNNSQHIWLLYFCETEY